jgi:hypothetical protein
MNAENLGPAERILNSILTYTDHCVHNRPGVVVPDNRTTIGMRWDYATYKMENGVKTVYRFGKEGKKTVKTRVGTMNGDRRVMDGEHQIGEWRDAGLYPEIVTWMYRQVADVWKMDNEFAARWASHQFGEEHRDLKVILAAFMLVQSRKGEPVLDEGRLAFYDDDFRDVGEAMMLIYKKDGKDLSPKLLLRIRDVLEVPGVVTINREMGFGRSLRTPPLGRWPKVVTKWLTYREENPQLLAGLSKAGFRTTVIALAAACGYKPQSDKFFEALRWKQSQSKDGRRTLAIGKEVAKAETWESLSEAQVCEEISREKPAYKKLVSLLPKNIGLTRAIMACAIETGCLSNKDLVIATPTIEELGLLEVQSVKDKWNAAVRAAEDMRAANIASRVKGKKTQEALVAGAEKAAKKAVEEVVKNIRAYVIVDRSGSMSVAIESAVRLITKLLPAFRVDLEVPQRDSPFHKDAISREDSPEDQKANIHVAYFNTDAKEVKFKARSGVAVGQAFKGITGSGGTDYGAGIRAIQHNQPSEEEDTLLICVGDQEAATFEDAVHRSGIRPMAIGFFFTPSNQGGGASWEAVEGTARKLGIPCFRISEATFEDPYAIPRTIRALVAATPVTVRTTGSHRRRETLTEIILKTPLLAKPTWAS